jgi:UDP-N-acetyl-D-mannosaminuronate dehydrogenase
VVSVIGLDYVGLPLAVAFAEAGSRVVGVDVVNCQLVVDTRNATQGVACPTGRVVKP